MTLNQVCDSVVLTVGTNPNGVTTEEICRTLKKSPQELGDAFEVLRAKGKLKGFAGLWIDPSSYSHACERFLSALDGEHAKTPQLAGIPAERVVENIGLTWSGKPLDRILSDLETQKKLTVSGREVRLHSYRPDLPPRQRQFLDRLLEALTSEPINVPNPYELTKLLHAPSQAIEETLRLGVQVGEIHCLNADVYYTPAQVEAIKIRMSEAAGSKSFLATQMRDSLLTTRKYLVPLLEYFDEEGFTIREGNLRRIPRHKRHD